MAKLNFPPNSPPPPRTGYPGRHGSGVGAKGPVVDASRVQWLDSGQGMNVTSALVSKDGGEHRVVLEQSPWPTPHQLAESRLMESRTENGQHWSPPTLVSTHSGNVHDTSHVRRRDGGVDLYYISQSSPEGFSTFRRCLRPDGTLGVEERVTEDSVGNTQKPEASRLSNGKLMLRFVIKHPKQPDRLAFAVIDRDAPLHG
ncbi:MAG TPA: hypothetical protein VEY30_12355 [Myxococcaceae bacterium]|nr:hypothetical protein [Myxococcaceae bacterium]